MQWYFLLPVRWHCFLLSFQSCTGRITGLTVQALQGADWFYLVTFTLCVLQNSKQTVSGGPVHLQHQPDRFSSAYLLPTYATTHETRNVRVTCNITLRRVGVSTLAVEKHKVLHYSVCVCACARGWVHACVWVCVRARAWARVALFNQKATRGRHIICGLSGSTTFFDIIS